MHFSVLATMATPRRPGMSRNSCEPLFLSHQAGDLCTELNIKAFLLNIRTAVDARVP